MSQLPTVYLDNAATSHPKPESVYRAVDSALRRGGSAGRGSHEQGLSAAREIFSTRELLAELFQVRASERFIFTANATQGLNQALFGLLDPGDRVVTTSMEHNAVIRPLRWLRDQGIEVVKVGAAGSTGLVTVADIKAACLSAPTRLLVMNHVSNVFGSVQPIEDLGRWCRQQDIVFLVDGSQSAGLVPIHLEELQIDLFAAPGHKGLLGPQGTGFLYLREGIDLRPLVYGGTGANSHSSLQPDMLPERYESGTFNIPGLAGLRAALQFLLDTGIEQIHDHENRLVYRLITGLAQLDGIQLYGPSADRPHGSAVSFTLEGNDPATVGHQLDQRRVAVRTGLHCSPDSHRTLGTFPTGTIRVSPGFFTTDADIDYFLDQIASLKAAAI
ncbi:MAG: aminotransferase class V-fold PLP-dependent enzyme [Pelovirga sp.]